MIDIRNTPSPLIVMEQITANLGKGMTLLNAKYDDLKDQKTLRKTAWGSPQTQERIPGQV